MARSSRISHPGRIVAVGPTAVEVEILAKSACAACHAQGLCTLSEQKAKHIAVTPLPGKTYGVGEEVTVYMQTGLGLMAVFWVYALPFVFFLIALLVFSSFPLAEYVVGLIIFVILLLYYGVLYGFRGRFKRKVYFTLEQAWNMLGIFPE